MDAGLAGLIGALGGGIIGAAGASAAALIAFRGARYQADQQRRATHEQWLRQVRREAYRTFLTHADTVQAIFGKALARLEVHLTAEELDALAIAAADLRHSASFLALDVPPELHARARFLGQNAYQIHFVMSSTVPPDARRLLGTWGEIHESLVESFSESVQELDSDGRP